jgi:pilus assembly protein CpaB
MKRKLNPIFVYAMSLAVVSGALGIVMANKWLMEQWYLVRSYNQPVEEPETETVVVVARKLDKGHRITQSDLKVVEYPAGSAPSGVYRKVKDVFWGGAARKLTVDMVANEPLLKLKFQTRIDTSVLANTLRPGHRAVSIKVNPVVGVSGFIRPGDFVDIFITRREKSDTDDERATKAFSEPVLMGVRVLAIDQSRELESKGAVLATTVTIEVNLEGAQKIALAPQVGELTLALRSTEAVGLREEWERMTVSRLSGDSGDNPLLAAVQPVLPFAAPIPNQIDQTAGVKPEPRKLRVMSIVRVTEKQDYELGSQTEGSASDKKPAAH